MPLFKIILWIECAMSIPLTTIAGDVKTQSESNVTAPKQVSDYDVATVMAILQAQCILEGIPKTDLNTDLNSDPLLNHNHHSSSFVFEKKEPHESLMMDVLKQEDPNEKKSEANIPKPNPKAFLSVYWYALLTLKTHLDCLLRDQLNYFLAHQNHPIRLNQRRFAVLCLMDNGKVHALILQLSKFNQKQAQSLQKEIQEKAKSDPTFANDTVESFLKDQKLVAQLKKLYTKVECFWIGCEKNGAQGQEVQALLKLVLKQAYSIPPGGILQVHINNLPEGPHHILLTEHISKMILSGEPPQYSQPSPQIALLRKLHFAALRDDFVRRLSAMPTHLSLQIQKKLVTLYKLSVLIKMRQKIALLSTATVRDIEELLAKDKQQKIHIYQNYNDFVNALHYFSHPFLVQMYLSLKTATAQTELWVDLKSRKTTHVKKIQQWETNLNQEIAKRIPRFRSAWFKHYGQKAVAFFYDSTMIQIGGNLLRWATQSCRKRLINKRTPLHLTLSVTRKIIKAAVKKKVTDSEQSKRAKQLNQWIDEYISPGGLVYLIGAGVGAWMTSGSSYYSMFRQVALILLGQKIYTGLQNSRIDEENAQYSNNYKDIKSIHCSFLAQVLITMTEFHFTGNIRYVFSAVGSSGTGLASVLILCKHVPELDRPASKALAEDAAHIKFLFYLAGSNIGYMAVSSAIEKVDFHVGGYRARYQERLYIRTLFNDTMQQLLQNKNITELEITLPDMIRPRISLSSPNTTFLGVRYPELSLLNKGPIFLGWRYPKDPMYYQTQCDLNTRLDAEPLMPANALVLPEESEPIVYCLPPSRSLAR